MRQLGLDAHISRIVNSAVTGYEKPHPGAFRAALAAVGPAESVCMIGDSMKADIAGATAVGIPAILVRKSDPGARLNCKTLLDVPKWLPGNGTVFSKGEYR